MKYVIDFLIDHWGMIATIMSVYWGVSRAGLDYVARIGLLMENRALNNQDLKWFDKFGIFFNWSIYQFIFNFVGSFLGWCCVYLLLIRIQPCLLRTFDLTDFILFLFSFLGITGHLPQSVYGLVRSLERLAEIVSNKLAK